MRTTDVKSAYYLRRKHLSSEYSLTDKLARGKITRSILNTDLSASTYEQLIETYNNFENFDVKRITKTQQKSDEINEWLLRVNENTHWISTINNPSRLSGLQSELQRIQSTGLELKELFNSFYTVYLKTILVVLEDTLIRIYIVEDTKTLTEELDSMLKNLAELNLIGGLAPNIKILSDISSNKPKSDEENPHILFLDSYAHISFVWSQCTQLVLDYMNSIESNEPISLEKTNQSLQQRMEQIANIYKTF